MKRKKITGITAVDFSVNALGLYIVSINARCWSGNLMGLWGGEDLRVEIDAIKPREIPLEDKPQYVDIPPAWNGTALKGLSKTVIFLLSLNKGNHTLKFIPTRSATIEKYSITQIQDPQNITFSLNEQSEDGDRRPWYTFALINLPLRSVSADVTVDWHFFDGDDVKIIIDGQIEKNTESRLWRNWIWHAKPQQIFSGPRKEKKMFTKQLNKDIHYIEFWADKTPILHTVSLDLGDYSPKRIPTVNDPEWTGDFADDPDQIILARALFGEIRDISFSDEARIAVGWSIRNRVEDSRWANTYQGVITKPEQYSAFNLDDPNRKYVENPLFTGNEIDFRAWQKAYEIAGTTINNQVEDPTTGANHYHDSSIKPPPYLTKEALVLTIHNNTGAKSLYFYRL